MNQIFEPRLMTYIPSIIGDGDTVTHFSSKLYYIFCLRSLNRFFCQKEHVSHEWFVNVQICSPRWGAIQVQEERREKIRMIAQYYFDWKGPRGTVKEYGEMLVKACEKTGAKFHGIYGPSQDKWNFVAVIEADDTVDLMKPVVCMKTCRTSS